MQSQSTSIPSPEATAATEDARPTGPPADLLIELATSLLAERARVIQDQQRRIAVLEAMLRAAGDCLRPEGCLIQ